jgi:hypothetical protein
MAALRRHCVRFGFDLVFATESDSIFDVVDEVADIPDIRFGAYLDDVLLHFSIIETWAGEADFFR